MVHFLYRKHSRMQFFNFCSQLRDGKPLEDALWRVYRFKGLAALEREFRASIKRSGGKHISFAASPAPAASRRGLPGPTP